MAKSVLTYHIPGSEITHSYPEHMSQHLDSVETLLSLRHQEHRSVKRLTSFSLYRVMTDSFQLLLVLLSKALTLPEPAAGWHININAQELEGKKKKC